MDLYKSYNKKIIFRAFVSFCSLIGFVGCSQEKPVSEYPIIDVIGNMENYQRVYCSEYFSSIELIPLETREDCLLDVVPYPFVKLKDNHIFMHGNDRLYAFDRSGKFLNQIGEKGQGPGEYLYPTSYFLNVDKPILYIENLGTILEYDFNGNFIRPIRAPKIEQRNLFQLSYVDDELFVGQITNDGKNQYKYCLFKQDGDVVKCFPNYTFFNREKGSIGYDFALDPIRIDNQLYLKDYVNDTLYILEDLDLRPAYIFDFGQYFYTTEQLEIRNPNRPFVHGKIFIFNLASGIVGTPKFFFYHLHIPSSFSRPKVKPKYNPIAQQFRESMLLCGIYNTEKNVNTLLDTDPYFQQGLVNDINGGLPIIPRYYAGNNIVIDLWYAEEMREMLTEEYFASQTIKDRQAHQKLKDILKNLKDDDNPVVVIAKLK